MESSVPPKLKHLRACLSCHLIKTFDQFTQFGCDNCEPYLKLQGDPDRVLECTSPRFSGMAGLMAEGEGGWVARWMRREKGCSGLYAGRVEGRLPEEVEEVLRANGVYVEEESA
jgi:transcription elongation factor SPT4